MPRIIVCPLNHVPSSVDTHQASHLVTLIKDGTRVVRPKSISSDRHLFLTFDDIIEPTEGLIPPAENHAIELLTFVGDWDQKQPMVIHCYAGISRSTAAAFITLCALRPERNEADIARGLRLASASATPNIRLVGFADQLLQRDGRMVSAIQAIGRGETAYEGTPFILPLANEA